MNHTTQNGCLLEVIEPPLSIWRIDECPLMRAVDSGGTLFQHNLSFVGTIDVLGSQYRLPTCSYTSFRDDEIVPAVALQPFRTLGDGTLVDGHALIQQLASVGRHLMYDDRASPMTATT